MTLQQLARKYGMDTEFDMVSDAWGGECKTTPREAITMHKMLGWSDSSYRVINGDEPGDAVLIHHDGNAILRIPEQPHDDSRRV